MFVCFPCEPVLHATISNTRSKEGEVGYTLQPFYLVKASLLRQACQLTAFRRGRRCIYNTNSRNIGVVFIKYTDVNSEIMLRCIPKNDFRNRVIAWLLLFETF